MIHTQLDMYKLEAQPNAENPKPMYENQLNDHLFYYQNHVPIKKTFQGFNSFVYVDPYFDFV